LAEAVGLARAIRLDVVRAEIARLARPHPGSLLGSGTLRAELLVGEDGAEAIARARAAALEAEV